MVRSIAAALAATAVLCACATPSDPNVASQPREEKEYRTGSNIPVRDRSAPSSVQTASPEAIERARSVGGRIGQP